MTEENHAEDGLTMEPWKTEPDYVKWVDGETGYHCMIRRTFSGALCGYVRVPRGHKFYERGYHRAERQIETHGGITFGGKPSRLTGGRLRGYWLGFDCAHYQDVMPGMPKFCLPGSEYRDLAYVKRNVRSMALQLKKSSKR